MVESPAMNATWINLPADAMNVAATFRLVLGRPAGGATLRLAAADFCRVWTDGRLVAHGPARTAHGYARVEEVPLPPRTGDSSGEAALPVAEGGDLKAEGRLHENGALVVFVEVLSAHVPCFDGVEQDAFFAAEVVAPDGRVLAGTADFEAWHDGTLVRRVRRFSYQRGFVESRRIAAAPEAFRRGGPAPEGWARAATVPRPLPRLLPRRAPRPVLDFRDAGAPADDVPRLPAQRDILHPCKEQNNRAWRYWVLYARRTAAAERRRFHALHGRFGIRHTRIPARIG